MTEPAFLIACGRFLYGSTSWQAPLARDLAVSGRTMRRWKAGTGAIPDAIGDRLCALCKDRAHKLLQLIGEAK